MLKFIIAFAALGVFLASSPANATTINFSTEGLPLPAGLYPRPTALHGQWRA